MIGTILGHYLILKKIRQGGKVDVFLAQDTNLNCLVILKFLSAEMYQDDAAARRYMREARAAATLDHPNICKILETGKIEGKDFIAMEFVDGETLGEKLLHGPMPFEDALEIAGQVAMALEAAHAKGIIHRNLKPGNVMVSVTGDVKVMDFGLLTQTIPPGGIKVSKGKIFVPIRADLAVGALAYMSPEQLRGKKADFRTDIFSFGVILFQMFSGMHPFHKEKGPDIASAILSLSPPSLGELRPKFPAEFSAIVNKMLAREAANRCASIGEIRVALEEISRGSEQAAQPTRLSDRLPFRLLARLPMGLKMLIRNRLKPVFWIASSALVLTCLMIWILLQFLPQPAAMSSPPVIPILSCPAVEDSLSISPDGSRVAFRWKGENEDNWDLYVKALDGSGLDRVTKLAAEDCCPAWSPDGHDIAFLRRHGDRYAISLASLLSEEVRALIDISNSSRLSWSPDGRSIAFSEKQSPEGASSIWSLSIATSERVRLTTPEERRFRDDSPAYSPDGRYLAFIRRQNADGPGLFIMRLPDGSPKRLTDYHSPTSFCWTGDSREIVYSSAPETGEMTFWRIAADGGEPLKIASGGDRVWGPSITGNRLVCLNSSRDRGIWRMDLMAGGSMKPVSKPLIMTPSRELNPSISPDGTRIAFVSFDSGFNEIWTCNSDGAFPVRITDMKSRMAHSPQWSPDGSRIAFDSDKAGNSDIYVVGVRGGKVQRITTDAAEEAFPHWSRDGRWVYYGSNKSGDWQIWRVPPAGGKGTQITKEGGMVALESADGKYLYYSAHPARKKGIWRVPAAGGPETLETEAVNSWDSWTLAGRGVYFLNAGAKPLATLSLFDFLTQGVRGMATVSSEPEFEPSGGLSVAPDERWLVYCGAFAGFEILTLDDFR